MDSLHLLHLGFLLLAVAACHPIFSDLDIAISSDDPAEGTEDSSSGKTRVAVYHCKDCGSSTCQSEPISFENFEKIAETEKETFSNGIIELVTNKTHILMCFQQASSLPEGVCGIFWTKAEGAGISCGILSPGENGRDNISTEEYKICCGAETNIWEPSHPLKCYTKPTGPKLPTPPAEIPDNPEPPTGKKNIVGIFFAVSLLWVLTLMSTMYCYFCHWHGQASRQDRQAPDEEHLTHA